MRVLAYIISAIGLVVAWPFAAMMTAFLHDSEKVPALLGVARDLMWYSLLLIPFAWVAGVVCATIVSRRKVAPIPDMATSDEQLVRLAVQQRTALDRKQKLLNRCAAAPYAAFALHLLSWIFVYIVAH